MRTHLHSSSASTSVQGSPVSDTTPGSTTGRLNDEVQAPIEPNTARARESAAAATAARNGIEGRGARLRRNVHQARLHGYAIAVIALVAVLIALVASNTARVHVDWLVGSGRVSLIWLVLAAAIIGWILGVLASARFQWKTRAPRVKR